MKNLLVILITNLMLLANGNHTLAQEAFKTQTVDFTGLQKIMALADGGDLNTTSFCQTFNTTVDIGLFATKIPISFCCDNNTTVSLQNCKCLPKYTFETSQDGSFSITKSSAHTYHGYFVTIRMGEYQKDKDTGALNIKFIVAKL